MNPLHEAWRWFSGNPEGGVLATAVALAEPAMWLVTHVRHRLDSGVLDLLREAAGNSGIGFGEDQIAGQSGAEPRKVRSALRRLEKRGRVRQQDGRWYVTGAGYSKAVKERFPY